MEWGRIRDCTWVPGGRDAGKAPVLCRPTGLARALLQGERVCAFRDSYRVDTEFAPVMVLVGCFREISTLNGFRVVVQDRDWHRPTGAMIDSYLA